MALCLRPKCLTDEKYKSKGQEYKRYLKLRGHDPKLINKSFKKVAKISRNRTREPQTNKK